MTTKDQDKKNGNEEGTSRLKRMATLLASSAVIIVLAFGYVFLLDTKIDEKRPQLESSTRLQPAFELRQVTQSPGLSPPVATQKQDSSQTKVSPSELDASMMVEPNTPKTFALAKVQTRQKFRFLENAKLLKYEVSAVSKNGFFLRVKIYNAEGMKYPMVRMVERWQLKENQDIDPQLKPEDDPQNAAFMGQSAMVADHIMVRLDTGSDPAEMSQLLTESGAEIRSIDAETGVTLVSFNGVDPKAMAKTLKAFSSGSGVSLAQPDYLATLE